MMGALAKTALIVCVGSVLCASCTTSRVVGDTQTPEVEVESTGIVWVGERQVAVGKIGKALKSAGVSRDEAVKVLVADTHDRVLMRAISSDLVMSGFKRPIFITDKKTQSSTKPGR
jgi:hypothetical protein